MPTLNHTGNPAPQPVGVRELRANLTDFLRQARQGQSFLITSHNQVIAEIHPPSPPPAAPRQPGTLRGKVQMSADFDTLPPDVLDTFEP